MNLQPGEVRKRQQLIQQRPDIREMRLRALRADVGLAAEDHVIVDREIVIEAFRLGGAHLHEFRQQGLRGLQFSGVGFEIGMDADGVGWLAHGRVVMVRNSLNRSAIGAKKIAIHAWSCVGGPLG